MQNISKKAKIGSNCKIGDYVKIHDNVILGNNSIVEDHCILGKPIYEDNQSDDLIIGNNSLIRSHSIFYEGSIFEEGKVSDILKSSDHLKELHETINKILSDVSAKSREYWAEKTKTDLYLTAQQYLDHAIIDKIEGE